MKIKFLSFIASFFMVSFVITSCLDDDNNIEYSPDATIHAFALDTAGLGSYKFTIDQLSREIYNEDSLPVHADTIIDKILIKTLTRASGVVTMKDKSAQAHGAKFEDRNVGTLGDLACFSFYPGKNLYAFGEGGSVTCQEEKYYKHIDRLKNQGCDVRYYHDEIGYNYRLEGLQGAVLSVSLKYLPEWTKRRQEIGHRYLKEITNPLITMQRHPENTTPVFHLFVITVPDHEDFIRYMAENDVECNMHYPVPCHLQKAYANLRYRPGDCPNAEYLAAHCVTLPLFPEMRKDEIARVIDLCNAYRQA